MKGRYSSHLVIFLVAILFIYIYSISPSFIQPKATITSQKRVGESLHIKMRVCPAFWLDDNSRENKGLKTLFRTTLYHHLQEQPFTDETAPPVWRVEKMTLDSEVMFKEEYQADGRCRDISLLLSNKRGLEESPPPNSDPIALLFQDQKLLRIGVRDKQGFISYFDNDTKEWKGAAIDFGLLIAEELGKKAVFTRLRSLDSRFFSLRYAVTDLNISLISHSAKRERVAYLSKPYYTTGLVLGTFLPGEGDMKRTSASLNSKQKSVVAVQGGSSLHAIHAHLPKINLVTTVTSSEIPGVAQELMTDQSRGEVFFVTDELIARRWPNSRLVYLDEKRLLTHNDKYVVAVENPALLEVVNRVITNHTIEALYERGEFHSTPASLSHF
ncbi:MAG: transporter substrate-binding domain-containing protein [Magnetococcales bacterium]|nr:transporter substrate-binding domain-containing protein [Magnetococcales bacterium]